MSPWLLAVTFVLVLVNGVFVATEFALVGSRRSRLEELAAAGDRRAAGALRSSSDLTMQLAGAQFGVTMASLGIGLFGEKTLGHLLEDLLHGTFGVSEGVASAVGLVVGLAVIVSLHMVLGEMVPKNLALSGPERALLILNGPSRGFLRLFRPVVRLLQASANAGIRAFGVEPREELTSAHTADELAAMLAESRQEGLIEDFAHDLMTGVLGFEGRDAASVMVPRDEIVCVSRHAPVRDVERAVVASGHSRLPVVDHDIDSVIGFVHSKDLLVVPPESFDDPLPLRIVRRMLVVPPERRLEELLLSMRNQRVHFALVSEPNGTTAGLVTLEDLLEELVGDILDESDRSAASPLPTRDQPTEPPDGEVPAGTEAP